MDSHTWECDASLTTVHFPFFSQQPTRFSNRCLQMIGRCWPHLRALGVGGAGCGVQGLASLGESLLGVGVCRQEAGKGEMLPVKSHERWGLQPGWLGRGAGDFVTRPIFFLS